MTTTQSFEVTGMTCGHCAAAVTEEVSAIASVSEVAINLVAGGSSTVTVTSETPVSADAVAAAVDEAGYTLVR
jgi:copper chaperone